MATNPYPARPAVAAVAQQPVLSGVAGFSQFDAARRLVTDHGFAAVALAVDFAVDDVSAAQVAQYRALAGETGCQLTVRAPFRDLNIASMHSEVYRLSVDEMLRAVDLAAQMGAGLVNVHPGMHAYFGPSYHSVMKERELAAWQRICRDAATAGVGVTVENLTRAAVHFEDTWTGDWITHLLRQLPAGALGVCIDSGHARQAGQDLGTLLRQFGPHLRMVHFHDNHGGLIDEHLPVGDGAIDWDAACQALRDVGFSGHVVLENMSVELQVRGRDAFRTYWQRTAA